MLKWKSFFLWKFIKFCTIGRVWGRSFLADARERYCCTQIISQTQTCLWETSACFMWTLSSCCTFTLVSHHMVHMCAYETPEGQFMWTSLICSFSQLKHWQAMIPLLQNNRISQIKNYIWLVYSYEAIGKPHFLSTLLNKPLPFHRTLWFVPC